MKLIPFNLEAALAGAEVRTRFGKKVTGLRLGGAGPYPVHAFCEGDEFSVTIKGEWAPGNEDGLDLFMVDPKRETMLE